MEDRIGSALQSALGIAASFSVKGDWLRVAADGAITICPRLEAVIKPGDDNYYADAESLGIDPTLYI